MDEIQRNPMHVRDALEREAKDYLTAVEQGNRPEPPPPVREALEAIRDAEQTLQNAAKAQRWMEGEERSEFWLAAIEVYEREVDDAAARLSEFVEKTANG